MHHGTVEPRRVHLWNDRAALEVTQPREGVLRLRHAPNGQLSSVSHPALPPKESFSVIDAGARPLQVVERDSVLELTGEGCTLRLERAPLRWSFASSDGQVLCRCLEVRGEAKVGYPVPHHRSTLTLEAPEGEAYLGFGEKVGPLDKRGMRLTFWNTDVLPHHPDTDPLYVSIPFFIALRGGVAWGLFLDESWRSEVDVASSEPDRLVWQSAGPELDVYLLAGPTPLEVVERYTALTGRTPLPPLWSLGAHQSRWGYESAADVDGVIAAFRERGLPLDCVHLDIDYMEGFKPWTWDRSRFAEPKGLLARARQQGVRLVPIIDPALKQEPGYTVFDEALAQNLLVRGDRGEVLVGEVWPKPAVFPDLTREDVQRWWAGWHRELLEDGIGGIWNDMNEPSCFSVEPQGKDLTPPTVPRGLPPTVEGTTLPYDARHGARRHLEVHNVYGTGMCRATQEAFARFAPERRPFVLTRAGFAGIQRHAAVWTGDNSSHWTHLESSVAMLCGLGASGVGFCGADIPGFLGRPDGELLVRWMQAGGFYPLMRNHGSRGSHPREPWRFGEPYLSLARAALERRYRLLPTLYTLMRECAETGAPVLRPLCFHAPEDPEALWACDQFLFGRDLLVAPVVRPGQSKRLAYLPAGRWLEFPNLEHAGVVADGPGHFVADAPLSQVPLWLREGGAIALTRPALHTTSALWPEVDWHVHVGPQLSGRLYEDEGDGAGPFRDTRLRGELRDGVLVLWRERTGDAALPRSFERLHLHGLGRPPVKVEGALSASVSEGAVVLEVGIDQDRIELHL